MKTPFWCALGLHKWGPVFKKPVHSQDSYTMAFAEEVWDAEKEFKRCECCGQEVIVKDFAVTSGRSGL